VTTRSLRLILPVMLAAVFLTGPSLVRFSTDWLWFGEAGYQQVFTAIIRSEASLFTIAFVLSVAWLTVNWRIAVASMRDIRPVFTTQQGVELALPGRQQAARIVSAVAMILAGLLGLFAASQWETWMTWRHAVPFGRADPVFGRDIAFYVFTLPFVRFVRGLVQSLVILAALGAAGLYLVSGSLTSGLPASVTMTPAARRHLSMLAALFFLSLAAGAWLGRFELLTHPAGAIYGASYADVYGRIPVALGPWCRVGQFRSMHRPG